MNDTTFQGDGKVAYVPVVVNTKLTKQTNYDRLVSKSPEELAEWLANNQDCYACPFFDDGEGICKGGDSCREMMLDWLKQEVDNGRDD